MAESRMMCGRQEVCRASVLFAAVLAAGFAGAADAHFVRPTNWQQNNSEVGNVPVVRIDSVVETSEKSQVVPVSYTAPAAQNTTASNSGKQLKWVSVTSPEARAPQTPTITVQKPEPVKTERLIQPIPSMMPRYSVIRLTSGEDSGLDSLNFENMDQLDAALPSDDAVTPANSAETENAVPVVPEAVSTPMPGAAEEGLGETLAMPANEEAEQMAVPADTNMIKQIPGAIGNNEENNMLNQGGLNQNMQTLESGNVEEAPKTQLPEPSVNAVPAEIPLSGGTMVESFTSRQVDESDYDMPCESSEPMHRITEITNDIDLHDNKIIPKSCPLSPDGEKFPVREFPGTNFTWTASNLCHNPLYFEQPDLERYGHTIGPLQPVLSGAQFLATVPALPMLMAIDPPNECRYALGYNRPGSCAPHKWSPIPFSLRGAIATGGVATALVFLIP